jgi:hypothetical protein
MLTFFQARVGEPTRHDALSVFPLFAQHRRTVPYLLSHEAFARRAVYVTEDSRGGSVDRLLVHNRADTGVLFLEGEELRGAKQNRVVNTSVLVAAKSQTTIPVSCVEQGRWAYRSPDFHSSDSHASSRLRHVLKRTVHRSASEGQGHASDQGLVWQEVGRQARSLGSHSRTGAMADTFDHCQPRIAEFCDCLRYVEGASGVAGAVGRKVVSVDLFDQPATCRKVWGRLLSGLILDALEPTSEPARAAKPIPEPSGAGVAHLPFDLLEYLISSFWQAPGPAGVAEVGPAMATAEVVDVWSALVLLNDARWRPGEAVGAGQELRTELPGGRYASALVCGGEVLHGSLVTAC